MFSYNKVSGKWDGETFLQELHKANHMDVAEFDIQIVESGQVYFLLIVSKEENGKILRQEIRKGSDRPKDLSDFANLDGKFD